MSHTTQHKIFLEGTEVKCRIKKWIPGQKVHYKFEILDNFITKRPKIDYLGENFYDILYTECLRFGYSFRFYTMSEDPKNFAYDVFVD